MAPHFYCYFVCDPKSDFSTDKQLDTLCHSHWWKKCLSWHNYLNRWPQCLMRTLPLRDIPGGIPPLQPCRHFKNRWEPHRQSACWSMMSKCCSNSFSQCWFTCFVCLLVVLIIVLQLFAPDVFDIVPLVH